MNLRNICLHESGHSVARQLLLGDLRETVVERRGTSYAYPVERRPFSEMSKERLGKTAVVVAAGLVVEKELCSDIGMKDRAVADDIRQWEGIQRIGEFTDEEMDVFWDKAIEIVHVYEGAIRRVALELDRRKKLTGAQVSRLIESAKTTKAETDSETVKSFP
jgi:hypothetical protein